MDYVSNEVETKTRSMLARHHVHLRGAISTHSKRSTAKNIAKNIAVVKRAEEWRERLHFTPLPLPSLATRTRSQCVPFAKLPMAWENVGVQYRPGSKTCCSGDTTGSRLIDESLVLLGVSSTSVLVSFYYYFLEAFLLPVTQ